MDIEVFQKMVLTISGSNSAEVTVRFLGERNDIRKLTRMYYSLLIRFPRQANVKTASGVLRSVFIGI